MEGQGGLSKLMKNAIRSCSNVGVCIHNFCKFMYRCGEANLVVEFQAVHRQVGSMSET